MAMLRIRKPDGSIVEIASLPGKKGEDGHTPQKGVDYFTEEEVAEFTASAKEYTDEKTAPATDNTYGTVKCWSDATAASISTGIYMDANGMLRFVPASEAAIDGKSNPFAPIVPANLEYAVKSVGDGYYALASDVGDVEAALDSILAMQESLIGGGA